jgi:hypothetical protein
MIGSRRIGIVLAASVVATGVALGSAAGAAGSKARAVEHDWSGSDSASGGLRSLAFTTQAVRKPKGGLQLPFKLKNWGFGAPVTCTGSEAPYSGYQLFPGYVGSVGSVSDPDSARGPKTRVRNGRISEHAVYEVNVYGIPKQITYDVTGRFTSPRTASGTFQVSTLWTHADGSTTSCSSGLITWSACSWFMGNFVGPPCAGYDPDEAPEGTFGYHSARGPTPIAG